MIAHVNDCHFLDTLMMVWTVGGEPDALAAELLDLTRDGMMFRARVADGWRPGVTCRPRCSRLIMKVPSHSRGRVAGHARVFVTNRRCARVSCDSRCKREALSEAGGPPGCRPLRSVPAADMGEQVVQRCRDPV
ncbi:MAG: DUF2470 domain-containing protein [Jatrophihabitans sp.]